MNYPKLEDEISFAVYWFNVEDLEWTFMVDYPTLAEANAYVQEDTVGSAKDYPNGQHWAILCHKLEKTMVDCFTSTCEAKFTPIVSGVETVV
jgi:hypothetical protein